MVDARYKTLVVDDDDTLRRSLRTFLEAQNVEVVEARNIDEAEKVFQQHHPEAVVLDYMLPDGDALSLLPRLREIDPSVPVVILTGRGDIRLAVRAIKEGADNFLTKPVELPALLILIKRLVDARNARRRLRAQQTESIRKGPDPFLGESPLIRQLAEDVLRVCETDSAVLIQGETGTGKGTLARWIHSSSGRSDGPYVSLNCAGLTSSLLESELFGHEKGAFTGAVATKRGLLETAHRGTLMLDEFGDMGMDVQPKLLTCLEERRFHRLGSLKERFVDIRLIVATNRDLQALVEAGRFRSDLYFRISTFPLLLPPLRERPEDIPILAHRLLEDIGRDLGRLGLSLTDGAVRRLREYDWPGNIRELRNVLERAILLDDSSVIGDRRLLFGKRQRTSQGEESPLITLKELERGHIERVLAHEDGHVGRAAKLLGISRSTLYTKLSKYGLAGK